MTSVLPPGTLCVLRPPKNHVYALAKDMYSATDILRLNELRVGYIYLSQWEDGNVEVVIP